MRCNVPNATKKHCPLRCRTMLSLVALGLNWRYWGEMDFVLTPLSNLIRLSFQRFKERSAVRVSTQCSTYQTREERWKEQICSLHSLGFPCQTADVNHQTVGNCPPWKTSSPPLLWILLTLDSRVLYWFWGSFIFVVLWADVLGYRRAGGLFSKCCI